MIAYCGNCKKETMTKGDWFECLECGEAVNELPLTTEDEGHAVTEDKKEST